MVYERGVALTSVQLNFNWGMSSKILMALRENKKIYVRRCCGFEFARISGTNQKKIDKISELNSDIEADHESKCFFLEKKTKSSNVKY